MYDKHWLSMFDSFAHLLLIVEHGTFTEAARHAHLSQPALTASIRRLEEAFGAQLLHRGRRGASLTAAAEALLPRARAALAAVAEGRRAVDEVLELRVGEVRLGADDLSFPTANATLQYSWALSETSALTDETAVTAGLGAARGDWRFTNDIGLTAGLNGIFSLRFSQKLTYLNEPVPGFRQTDVVVAAALVASF